MNEHDEFDKYQRAARESSWHPYGADEKETASDAIFFALALCGESGEVANLLKKVMRGDMDLVEAAEDIVDELGDVLWYMARLADAVGVSLSTVSALNLQKIRYRKQIAQGQAPHQPAEQDA